MPSLVKTTKYSNESPKDEITGEESLPIVFAEIAPPIVIFSPPGTEYKVKYFFLTSLIISEIKTPASTSIIFLGTLIFVIFLK